MRALTAKETAALPPGFIRAVPVDDVRLLDREHPISTARRLIGLEPVIIVRGAHIFWPGLVPDLSLNPMHLSLLAHELTHVWQYANGMTLWRYLWRERGRYRYRAQAFDALGYEQQAAMVEDWVRLRCGLHSRYCSAPVDIVTLDALIPFHD